MRQRPCIRQRGMWVIKNSMGLGSDMQLILPIAFSYCISLGEVQPWRKENWLLIGSKYMLETKYGSFGSSLAKH